MIYTIPGAGFVGSRAILEQAHIADVTTDGTGATEIDAAINTIIDILEAFNLAAT
mgnify:CR=1 FL=1